MTAKRKKPADDGANPLWGGRFAAGPAAAMAEINASIDFDRRLYAEDIAGSQAHAAMLVRQGILSPEDGAAIAGGLEAVLHEIESGDFPFSIAREDIHMNVEARLADLIGPVAGRLHTARSRNDQVATDFRIWVRGAAGAIDDHLRDLQAALLDRAEEHAATVMPGFTHLQPAQPVTFGHHLLAYVEMFGRDRGRFADAKRRLNECPLGAAALAGTGFPIDRNLTSDLLGFSGPTGNTYGSIATVDYLLESTSAAAVSLAGMGRVVQDLLLWCTVEFDYLRLEDGFVQSSSIMPQKRNPVALEHARAIGSRALGQVAAILISVHNTPFGDIVDTEDDLQPLVFSMFRDATRAMKLVAAALRGAEVNTARLRERTHDGWITATELADTFTREHGLPFRTSHTIVARLIAARERNPTGRLADALATVSADVLGTPLQYGEQDPTSLKLRGTGAGYHWTDWVRDLLHAGLQPFQLRPTTFHWDQDDPFH